ncbi:MAG: Endoglucanase [Methanomicrobiales archaeon 53_19]|uniref:M42 family metallopeptidase n=1 Tax=Methanocalculus sp. TaxID=2004547 RepID=UPI000747CEBE|nr:M42 family metallopeptidase [Methanocalculus sp.]KUK70391.1 MAG: Endoglucanase [Methanocalculus sp. 52_23]KUL04290.1 MAG: Endoglucanase [Methanomicrobiales archaeon 53_19]HIJ06044.1 M42 family metallopeptidase [Methanocalculus sp.]
MVLDLLRKLSDAHGLSSREQNIREIIKEEIASYVDEIRTDSMGNLIAVRKGGDFKVMVAAHMDEIGCMAQYIDDRGFIRFVTIGGWFTPALYAQRVILHGTKGPVTGVLGGKPPHMMSDDERKKPLKPEDLFIDIGVSSAEEAADLGIEIGCPITIDRDLRELAGSRVTGKAFDDRVGVAMIIEMLKQLETEHTVYAVFTVQEEVGLKGAKTSAYAINPNCAIAIDVTIPGDHPGIEKKDASIEMGKGPVIILVSASGRGLLSDQAMVDWLRRTADESGIPYQIEVGTGGNTDATIIHLEQGGIPSVPFSIPARYIHSPVEVVDMQDVRAGIRILSEAMKRKP